MVKTLKEIQHIAEMVRARFEKKEIPKEELIELYAAYNFEVEPKSFVEEAVLIFPKLNCGLASLYLQKVLGGDVIRGKYKNNNHTFLLLDGLVVDITADQYGGPKVYVGRLKDPWSLS